MNIKKSLILIGLFLTLKINAETYYFSTSGDDSHTAIEAQSPRTPWRSLKKASSFDFEPGDSVLFKSGDIFRGTLIIRKTATSERPIVYSSYGEGNKPVFIGSETIKNWNQLDENVYVANLSKKPFQVFLDDKPMINAREPDTAYYRITQVLDEYKKFKCSDLSGKKDWSGGSLHIRSQPWTLDARSIASYKKSTGMVTLNSKTTYTLEEPEVFFINNHLSALDKPGEWYFDESGRKLYIHLKSGQNPSDLKIDITTANAGISVVNSRNIIIDGFDIKYHNMAGILVYHNSSKIKLLNNTIHYPYSYGISIDGGSANTIKNNTIYGPVFYGIYCSSKGSLVENNYIHHVGIINRFTGVGMGHSMPSKARGLQINGGNITVRHNVLDSIGYIGIGFNGNNNLIEKNIIRYFCLSKYDGSAIYTWSKDYNLVGGEGTVIKKNIVIGGTGPDGAMNFPKDNWGGSHWWYNGIYLDNHTHDIKVIDNSIYNTYYGIYLHSTKNHIVINNTIYGSNSNSLRLVESNKGMGGNILKSNRIFAVSENYYAVSIISEYKSLELGDFNNNIYYNPYSKYTVRFLNDTLNKLMTLSEWQDFLGDDKNSSEDDLSWKSYEIEDTVTSNLITNSTFENTVNGWKYRPDSLCSIKRVESETHNEGCLRTFCPSGVSPHDAYTISPNFRVKEDKTYLLEFDAKSEEPGTHQLIVRMNDIPWPTLFSKSYRLTEVWKRYNYTFKAGQSESKTHIDFKMYKGNSDWCLDNVKFYQVNLIDMTEKSRFFYNTDLVGRKISIGEKTWRDLENNFYESNIYLPPYSSKILILENENNKAY